MSDRDPKESPPIEAVPDIVASPEEGESADGAAEAPPRDRATYERSPNPRNDSSEAKDHAVGVAIAAPLTNGGTSSDSGSTVEPLTPEVTAVSLPAVAEEDEQWTSCHMTWRGKAYEFRVGANDLVYDFRRTIQDLTNVPPKRQKLVGLVKGNGKLSSDLDGTRFGNLETKKGDVRFTMIGTPENQSFVDPSPALDAADDFDVLYSAIRQHVRGGRGQDSRAPSPAEDPRNKRKVQDVIRSCPITVMNEPRPGKGLLVLDLDYTIVDTKPLLAQSLPAEECARPHMHDFLEMVYPHYDIVVWSQTHWIWLETKLSELGVIGGSRNYKICFVADRAPMFPIFSVRSDGQRQKHEVKPLEFFWAKFPQWSARNTIHIDDLSRNFAMNPGEGLKIRAFKSAGTVEGANDRELLRLGPYLKHIAQTCDDFTTLDHATWKRWNAQ